MPRDAVEGAMPRDAVIPGGAFFSPQAQARGSRVAEGDQ